jgi:hypothetical protein
MSNDIATTVDPVLAARLALQARGLPADDLGDAAALAVAEALAPPRTVYLVSEGSGSDYRIEGVFSTREKAQAYIDRVGPGDGRGIEEYVLDERQRWEHVRPWGCMIDLDTGEIFRGPERATPRMMDPGRAVVSLHWRMLGGERDRIGHYATTVTSPVSAGHARKVAAEKRQEWLRLRAQGVPAGEIRL